MKKERSWKQKRQGLLLQICEALEIQSKKTAPKHDYLEDVRLLGGGESMKQVYEKLGGDK